MKLPYLDMLSSVGFVGERKALALLCLGFYTTLFFMIGLSARTELPEWVPVFTAMTLMYGVAFFGVAAEWFWGRWFATGLAYWGMSIVVMAWVATRSLPPPLVIFGLMHVIVYLCLSGEKMAAAFDAKPAWRERWKLDEEGVVRVRKSVTRAASSLPALVMFALAPREGQELLALSAFSLALVGFAGLLLQRAYGVLALLGGAAATAALCVVAREPSRLDVMAHYFSPLGASVSTPLFGLFAAALLAAAAMPFLGPMAAFLRRR